ncbi:hypothetical protein HNR22_002339 [Micromonospora jinlongensis]|uniref:PIN like domain-containing protein n=1 Tax=Micromonospora jinlongensis TaxID=1287877 RepID=A0A7Z0BER3_9ACTN|nr:PIN domain-containing protein [Micromonospora jinlongensis]NYH42612.1 hypothetical protein [Micromonospora jinlongensis]
MTKNFSSGFAHFLAPTDETVRTALTTGMIVLDTNVLLSAYRFAPKAREELLSTLERLQDRLWIPHQVGLEFHRNRLEVMAGRRATYDTVLSAIATHKAAAEADLESKIRSLSNRAALTDVERDQLLQQLSGIFDPLEDSLLRLSNDHAPADKEMQDGILALLQVIIGDHIGSPFQEAEGDEAIKEAERRIKEKIPPGFKDADKTTKHGDYFVWRQTLDEAKHRSTSHLVFVTGDQKDDWYLKVRGKIVAAHPELAEEAQRLCGVQLVMMTTQTLLYHAKQYLNADVSTETIRQAGELPASEALDDEIVGLRFRRNELRQELHFTSAERMYVRDQISKLKNQFAYLNKQLEGGLPPAQANKSFFEKGRIQALIVEFEERLADRDVAYENLQRKVEAAEIDLLLVGDDTANPLHAAEPPTRLGAPRRV